MTDHPDDMPPEAHAAAIYSQGVPLARKGTNILFNNNAIPGGGSQVVFSGQALDQPSFHAIVYLTSQSAAATIPFGFLTFDWIDAASGQGASPDIPILPGGNLAQCVYLITGPARADHLTLSINNLDPAQLLSWAITVTQSSHTYTRLRIQETLAAAVPGLIRPGLDPGMGVLASIGTTIPISSNVQRLAATWAGRAILATDNIAGTVPVQVRLLDPGVALGGSPLYGIANSGIIASLVVAAGAVQEAEVALPNGPVVIEEINASAASTVQPTTTLIRIDH